MTSRRADDSIACGDPADTIALAGAPARGGAGTRVAADIRTAAPGDHEWQAVADGMEAERRFATSAWIGAWGAHFLPHEDWRPPLRYLTARSADGRLRAVVPLATQRKSGIAIASLGGFYWPYRTPIVARDAGDATFDALASALTRSRAVAVRFGPVPERLAAVERLNAALSARGWRVRRATLGTTFAVDLPATWDAFERTLGRHLRRQPAYYERKMRREGALEIRRASGTGAPWAGVVADLAQVEAQSWQAREGGAPRFAGERNQAFWRAALAQPPIARMASAWLMRFDGEPASFCFCLDCGDTRYILANHYAERVRAYTTGSILYRHVFRDAVESGTIRRVDIGLGDPGYKSRWGATPSSRLVDWIAFRPGLRGRLLDAASALGRGLARAASRHAQAGEGAHTPC